MADFLDYALQIIVHNSGDESKEFSLCTNVCGTGYHQVLLRSVLVRASEAMCIVANSYRKLS